MRQLGRLLLSILFLTAPAQGAELVVVSGNGAKPAVSALATAFSQTSGHRVHVHFAVNPDVRRKVEAGEAFDVAVLNPPVLDALIAQGKIDRDSRTVLGRAGIGVGVRSGTPKPDLSSVGAFTRTLKAARSVAYPGEGASGIYFVSVLDRLGIRKEMQPKLKPMRAEDTVEVVGRGEADMVVVVAPRIVGVANVELVGLIPPELQTWIGFTAGMNPASHEVDAARDLLRYLASPAAEPVLRRVGIEPFVE